MDTRENKKCAFCQCDNATNEHKLYNRQTKKTQIMYLCDKCYGVVKNN